MSIQARWMHETSFIPFGEGILTQVYIKTHVADQLLLSEGKSRFLLENCLDVQVWRKGFKKKRSGTLLTQENLPQ